MGFPEVRQSVSWRYSQYGSPRDVAALNFYTLHDDAELVLVTANEPGLDFREQRDRCALRTSAPGAANSMQIRFAHRRHIEIEDVRHGGNVEPASGQI